MARQFTVGLWLVAATVLAIGCTSQPPSDGTLRCVKHIDVPLFPAIADSARAQATIEATASLGAEGELRTLSLVPVSGQTMEAKLFLPAVGGAMSTATYAPACAGGAVHVVFDFRLTTRSDPGPSVHLVAFEAPNRFRISVTPPVISTASEPSMVPSRR